MALALGPSLAARRPMCLEWRMNKWRCHVLEAFFYVYHVSERTLKPKSFEISELLNGDQ